MSEIFRSIIFWYYKQFYNIQLGGCDGTLVPKTCKGKFVSVFQKGKVIQIIDHYHGYDEYDEIRIIPYQPNHGIMVEKLKNNKFKSRDCLDFNSFKRKWLFATNTDEIIEKSLSRYDTIDFLNWILKNDYEKIHDTRWCKKYMSVTKSSEELLEEYLKSKN